MRWKTPGPWCPLKERLITRLSLFTPDFTAKPSLKPAGTSRFTLRPPERVGPGKDAAVWGQIGSSLPAEHQAESPEVSVSGDVGRNIVKSVRQTCPSLPKTLTFIQNRFTNSANKQELTCQH